jgi:hypothetical protein
MSVQSVVGSVNANALLLCGTCTSISYVVKAVLSMQRALANGARTHRLTLGIMNAKLQPCALSLVSTEEEKRAMSSLTRCATDQANGIRLSGAVMALWSSLLALVATSMDDPGATIVYEVRTAPSASADP